MSILPEGWDSGISPFDTHDSTGHGSGGSENSWGTQRPLTAEEVRRMHDPGYDPARAASDREILKSAHAFYQNNPALPPGPVYGGPYSGGMMPGGGGYPDNGTAELLAVLGIGGPGGYPALEQGSSVDSGRAIGSTRDDRPEELPAEEDGAATAADSRLDRINKAALASGISNAAEFIKDNNGSVRSMAFQLGKTGLRRGIGFIWAAKKREIKVGGGFATAAALIIGAIALSGNMGGGEEHSEYAVASSALECQPLGKPISFAQSSDVNADVPYPKGKDTYIPMTARMVSKFTIEACGQTGQSDNGKSSNLTVAKFQDGKFQIDRSAINLSADFDRQECKSTIKKTKTGNKMVFPKSSAPQVCVIPKNPMSIWSNGKKIKGSVAAHITQEQATADINIINAMFYSQKLEVKDKKGKTKKVDNTQAISNHKAVYLSKSYDSLLQAVSTDNRSDAWQKAADAAVKKQVIAQVRKQYPKHFKKSKPIPVEFDGKYQSPVDTFRQAFGDTIKDTSHGISGTHVTSLTIDGKKQSLKGASWVNN